MRSKARKPSHLTLNSKESQTPLWKTGWKGLGLGYKVFRALDARTRSTTWRSCQTIRLFMMAFLGGFQNCRVHAMRRMEKDKSIEFII